MKMGYWQRRVAADGDYKHPSIPHTSSSICDGLCLYYFVYCAPLRLIDFFPVDPNNTTHTSNKLSSDEDSR